MQNRPKPPRPDADLGDFSRQAITALGVFILFGLPGILACDSRRTQQGSTAIATAQDAHIEQQIERYDAQLDKGDRHFERMEAQHRRFEALLARWEAQADRLDRILDRWDQISERMHAAVKAGE